MILRHAIATVAALTVTAALAPSAHAWTTRFTFSSMRGAPALVTAESPYDNTGSSWSATGRDRPRVHG